MGSGFKSGSFVAHKYAIWSSFFKNIIRVFRLYVLFISLILVLSNCSPKYRIGFSPDDLVLIPVASNSYILGNRFIAKIDNRIVVVEKGFKTDLASIPKILWPVFNPYELNAMKPAILHDWLYFCPRGFTRKESDDIFYASLIDNSVHPAKAYLYYIAVRLFGWMHFNKDASCEANPISSRKEISH